MRTLGILGGLGPMAIAYFLQLLTQMTDAATDQEHMEILLYNKPSIPDRTGYITGKRKRSPVGDMVGVGKKLKEMGADILAIPCITAHFFHQELEKEIGLPIIHAIEETEFYLEEEKAVRVGILATDGTIQSGLFQNALKQRGICPVIPDIGSQKSLMEIIYQEIKAGKEVNMSLFYRIVEELFNQGAEVILLACTELSLIKRDYNLPTGCLDVMEVLARKAVQSCNRVREEYARLIVRG